ncbi:MAG: hypothetical protein IKZ49_02790 [Alphaproteobacteria bacterium]|nr:hypothetical protein [Alphaproteobacteria bacterium]
MKKTKLVFSLVREQSIFMTAVIAILSFLSIVAFGISLSIASGVIRWNNQWDKYATIQVMKSDNIPAIKQVFNKYNNKIESVREIPRNEMEELMKPWISSGAKLNDYLPSMFEIKLKDAKSMEILKSEISNRARFLTHNSALKSSISSGWKLVSITTFVLFIILASIGICISYISRNIAMLHKHELEILNQIGASDKFVATQMQIIVGKISSFACLVGFLTACPILFMILGTAQSARVGLLATLYLSGNDWLALMLLPIIIVMVSVYITKKTTLKILSEK